MRLWESDGTPGLVLYNRFLEPNWKRGSVIRVTLSEHFARQGHYIAGLGGWQCIGIGSDLDGGFGRVESPEEIDTVADLGKIADVLPEAAREPVPGKNWLRFLRQSLP